MVHIWRSGDNFCAFETLSKTTNLKKIIAMIKKHQSFCYPSVHAPWFDVDASIATIVEVLDGRCLACFIPIMLGINLVQDIGC
jgi:hypothetical protein